MRDSTSSRDARLAPGRWASALLGAVIALVVCLGLAGRADALPPVVGIADQNADMFSDPVFTGIGIANARLVVPWDVMDGGFQRAELFVWMRAARAAGVTPLITFGPSRRAVHHKLSPSPAEFQHQFRQIRVNFPEAKEFSTWNEPNHCGQAVCRKPELAARYFDAMVGACPSCTILGADMLDTDNMAPWVRRFLKAAKHEPRGWALHNYVDANRFTTKGTKLLLKLTKGQVWFTETGGIVKRTTRGKVPLAEGVAHAAAATRWLFDKLVPLSPRIRRVYLYHWRSVPPGENGDGWDSGLLDRFGRPRQAFRVVEARVARGSIVLGRSGRPPAAPVSATPPSDGASPAAGTAPATARTPR